METLMESFNMNRLLYAMALIEYAEGEGLYEVFQQIWTLVLSGKIAAENAGNAGLMEVLAQVPRDELESVLLQFIEIARGRMDTHKVEVISAVPLTKEQLHRLEIKLIQLYRKQLDITSTVDPSLLGGLRIVIDDMVIDHSVKHRLQDMKQAVYRGVYLNDGT